MPDQFCHYRPENLFPGLAYSSVRNSKLSQTARQKEQARSLGDLRVNCMLELIKRENFELTLANGHTKLRMQIMPQQHLEGLLCNHSTTNREGSLSRCDYPKAESTHWS